MEIGSGGPAQVPTTALWTWDLSGVASGFGPSIVGYGSRSTPTKTGLTADDLAAFVGIPLSTYGNPPQPISPSILIQWIRYAEDIIEQQTNLLLCPTWIASPASKQVQSTNSTKLGVENGQIQQQGIDYDIDDAPYDFFFPRAQDEGWQYQSLRYKPVRAPNAFPNQKVMNAFSNPAIGGLRGMAYIYPLLNDFFNVPASWFVEDSDFGLIRLVPSQNIQMLPLFAMQLAFMGFAESIPGGLWIQYTAGLGQSEYAGRFSFIKQLVLAQATIQALTTMQLSINYGATNTSMTVDGLEYKTTYNKDGAFAGQINQFKQLRDQLLAEAINKVSGPNIITL